MQVRVLSGAPVTVAMLDNMASLMNRCPVDGHQSTMLTPEEFSTAMQHIAKRKDTEMGHSDADDLMCCLLRNLGYGDGVDIYEAMDRWYA